MSHAIALAASRSTVPTAWVTRQSLISAWLLSMSTWRRAEQVALLRGVGIALARQQSVWITAGAMDLLLSLMPLKSLLAFSCRALEHQNPCQGLMAGTVGHPGHRSAPARHGKPRSAAGFHPPKSALDYPAPSAMVAQGP